MNQLLTDRPGPYATLVGHAHTMNAGGWYTVGRFTDDGPLMDALVVDLNLRWLADHTAGLQEAAALSGWVVRMVRDWCW